MTGHTPEDEPSRGAPLYDDDPPHPDGFGGSDEGSHYMSQTRIARAPGHGISSAEDQRVRERLVADPSEARELLTVFLDRYPEMRRWIREPVIHELKTWTAYYEAISEGRKTFEIRKDDRDFRVGDVLRLRDFDPTKDAYTGAQLDVVVTYITDAKNLGCLESGYVCMSIRRVP
jgi:hypothetical protein